MKKKKPAPEERPALSPQEIAERSAQHGVPEEVLQGPPALETLEPPQESALEAERRLYTSTGPELSAGDVDANWQRDADVGEEAVGGTVATPDQDVVDEITKAVGVPRAPDEEFRPSSEILDARDRFRWESEDSEPAEE
ncbi:MAG TPA: DUF6335 family protein [Methylomirabilota bacterium]|nr:DUF6335 family protein [Methylomirabilota bacterium]